MLKNRVLHQAIMSDLDFFFKEDGLADNHAYLVSLPKELITCELKFKSDLVIAGIPYFTSVFKALGADEELLTSLESYEGKSILATQKLELKFRLPFDIAISGERLALNLLAHASRIATHTSQFVYLAKKTNIAILDTRKTTPGLRSLEKYAVTVGGGYNHRMNQTDVFMIKDNHKKFFGGVVPAIEFFKNIKSFYRPLVLEIHTLDELREGIGAHVHHFLLDNFTPNMIKEAVALKKVGVTYEVSGGITLQNLDYYLIDGVDAISSGSLTYSAPSVDISLKMERIGGA